MKPNITPYLFFSGRCEEALEFYESVLSAKRGEFIRFEDAPESPPEGMVPANWEKKVMHVSFHIGDTLIMASDGCGSDEGAFNGFALSISPDDEAEAKVLFDALVDGGEVEMPLGKTFWSPCFGSIKDKFGVSWMISVEP